MVMSIYFYFKRDVDGQMLLASIAVCYVCQPAFNVGNAFVRDEHP